MKKEHILIEKAFKCKIPTEGFFPENCSYNSRKGYWIMNNNGNVLMLSDKAPASVSKKHDRETGEDKKGE